MVGKAKDPTALKVGLEQWVEEMKKIFGEIPQPRIWTAGTPVAKRESNNIPPRRV